MATFSKEFLQEIVQQFNKIETLGDEWDFIKKNVELEQVNTVMVWLVGNLEGETALERIRALKWLLEFVDKVSKQYPEAKKRLQEIT